MATKDFVFKIKADSTSFQKGVDTTKESLAALKKEQDDLARDGKAAFDKTRTAAERYAAEVEKLKAQLKGGAIDQQTFSRGVSQARGEMIKSRASSMGLSSSLMGLANPATLAAAAFAGLAAGVMASHKAFGEDKKAADELAMSLKSLGESGAGLNAAFAANAKNFGYGSSDQRAAYTAMIRITGDAKQAEADLKTAMDISARTGASLTDSAKAIADARRGNIGGLQQLTLLGAREAELLGQVSDTGQRAALALKTIEKHTTGAASETEGLNKRLSESTENFDAMKIAVGGAADALANLAKGNPDGGFFSRHLANAMDDIRRNMDYIALGAKYLGSDKSMDEFVADMVKAEKATKATATAVGEMSTAYNQMTSDGLTEDERAIRAVVLKKEVLEIEKRNNAAVEQRQALQAKEVAATRQRIAQLRFDLQITTEIDDKKREQLRLEKEIAQIKSSTANSAERDLKIELAREQSAIKIHDIEVKTRRDSDKVIEELDKKRQDRVKALEDDGKRLTESLRTPLQKYNDEIKKLNELLEAGAISQEVYAAGIRKNNDDRARQTVRLFGDADKIRKDQMQKAHADAKALGDSLFSAIEQSFIDPFEQGVEGIMKSLLKNLAIAGGKKLIESGITAISSGAGFASGGYTGSGNPSDVAGVVHRNEMVMESPIVRGQESDWAQLRSMVQQGTPVRDIIAGPTSVDGTITIINNVDNEAAGFIRSSAGQSAIMNTINKNAPAIRRILRS